jgi:hypothetical protein
MNLTYKKDIIFLSILMVLLAGCATDNPDTLLRGRLITEIYPAFNVVNLPIYTCYKADKFEADKLPEIKECIEVDGDNFQIILAHSPGNDKYLIVNRFGRIIKSKGFK